MTRRLTAALLLALIGETLGAQDLWNLRGVGMARAVGASARGIEALGVNPANLAYPEGHTVFIALPSLDVSVRAMIGLDTYKDYFTGVPGPSGTRLARVLDDRGKADLLSRIPDIGTNRGEVEMMVAAIAVSLPTAGSFGISVVDRIGVQALISKDFFNVTQGFTAAGSTYDLSETDVSAWYYREVNFSYARRIPISTRAIQNLYAGISVKAVLGYGVAFTDHNAARVSTVPDPFDPTQYFLTGNLDIQVNRAGIDLLNTGKGNAPPFQLFPAPAGTGVGIDFGVLADLSDGIIGSVSVSDIGSISWKRNTKQSTGAGSISIADLLTDAGQKKLKDAFHTIDTARGEFSTPLPTALRFGVSLDCDKVAALSMLPSRLVLAMEYRQGLTESLGNSIVPRAAVGMEYRGLTWLPVRTGLALGGGDAPRWTFGFGFDLHTWTIDFATDNFGMVMTPRSFQKASFGFGMKWKF